jgi:hypothetical protein
MTLFRTIPTLHDVQTEELKNYYIEARNNNLLKKSDFRNGRTTLPLQTFTRPKPIMLKDIKETETFGVSSGGKVFELKNNKWVDYNMDITPNDQTLDSLK